MAAAFTNPAGGALDEARELLAQAVELDPGYAPALALAGYFEAKAFLFGRHPDGEAGKRHALDLAERAVQADPEEPLALGAYGFVSANASGDLDRASRLDRTRPRFECQFAAAVELCTARIYMYIGEHDRAIECLHRSMRRNPLDQRTITQTQHIWHSLNPFPQQPEEAVRLAQRAVVLAPNPLSHPRYLQQVSLKPEADRGGPGCLGRTPEITAQRLSQALARIQLPKAGRPGNLCSTRSAGLVFQRSLQESLPTG